MCANDVGVRPGRIVYTQWLNARGGIEADLTVTRLAEDDFLIVTAAATEVRDFDWLRRHIPADARCALTNVTSAMAVISIMGPNARSLLQSLSPDDLSHKAFPFANSREIELGYAVVRASRITYVGELGWELYIPTEFTVGVYDAIVAAGERVSAWPTPAITRWTRCASRRPIVTGATTSPTRTRRWKRAWTSP